MLTPGPIMSGFKIPGNMELGPLEEKAAAMGADEFPIAVPLNLTVAIGLDVVFF